MIQRLRDAIEGLRAPMTGWRRHLHAHPELSFQEHRTSDFVAETLAAEGINARRGLGRLDPGTPGTGLIALVRGEAGPSDRCFALRGEMDALPIEETGGKPYASRSPGTMHACGHDAHTAMALGAGIALHRLRAHWSGTVMLVFQPGEEKEPGGASLLLKEGALRDPAPDGILGQHVTPEIPVGKVGFRAGPFMASADEVFITVKGKGGHAAMPHKLIDPVLIAAHLITALQQVVSRRARPGQATVLSFGKVIANGATNIIPDEVRIEGTLRTFDEAWRRELHTLVPEMVRGLVRSMGGEAEAEVRRFAPPVVNEPALTARIRAAAEEYLGADNVIDVDQRMGAEDFAHYSQAMPACFYRLGTGNPAKPGTTSGLHRPDLDIDEDALGIGAGVMAWGALGELVR